MKKPLLEKLIQEIAMFDMAAAFTLHCRKEYEYYRDKDNLDNAMAWRKTPEGYEHWNDVNDKLKARRKNYHPHRDLMIEYANDKTIGIQAYDEDKWEDVSDPCFFPDCKYRKKPNVTKKVIECRIYLDTHGEINIIECRSYLDTHGEINIVERDAALNIRNLKKWIGDWQKVEIEVEQND